VNQQPLIEKTLERFGMKNCAPKYTPLSPGIEFVDSQSIPIPPSDKLFMLDKDYMGLIGCLNHISQGTRPDISFSVSLLQRYAQDPRPTHWASGLHLLAYLKTMMNYKLKYRRRSPDDPGSLKPIGYADASHSDIKEEHGEATRKSTMGYVFKVAGAAVSWNSSKQKVVALSTTEEYLAMVHAGKQARWMWKFLKGIEMEEDPPFPIHVDNTSSISLTEATTKHARTKHFDTAWAWIRDSVRSNELEFKYIPSNENVADMMTKSLSRPAVEKFVKELGLVNE
jgi:hypothetical protein